MKTLPAFLLLLGACGLGIMIGWYGRAHSGRPASLDSASKNAKNSQTIAGGGLKEKSRNIRSTDAAGDDSFKAPQNESDRTKIVKRVREAIEKNTKFPARMIAVSELIAMMNPENAAFIREGFEQSWKAGFNYDWERELFLARYGEVLGKTAAEEYLDDPRLGRVINSWAHSAPAEAIQWVNGLEDGPIWEQAMNSVIWGTGLADRSYSLRVFEELNVEQRPQMFASLFGVYQRTGGAEACADLTRKLMERNDPNLRVMGTQALKQTQQIFQGGDPKSMEHWLETLEPRTRELLETEGKLAP